MSSIEEIKTALKVLDEQGQRLSYPYDKLVGLLPFDERPEQVWQATLRCEITGTEPTELTEKQDEQVVAAVRKAWQPVTVKVGRKQIVVRVSPGWALDY